MASALLALLLCVACSNGEAAKADSGRALGLFTTLPILWNESEDVAGLLRGDSPPHWALAELRGQGELRPVDSLAGEGGASPLSGLGLLIMAQPRPLSPQENVSLDDWVRDGGRVLLFADPLLTEDSAFGIGDKRRPQDVALLSPILARWGLTLNYDEDQPLGERMIALGAASLPVNLAGHFIVAPGRDECALTNEGLVARCKLGEGEVLAVADAALFERGATDAEPRKRALRGLIAAARTR